MAIFNMVYKKSAEKQRATQGPAPDGFHVPTVGDRGAINNVGATLGAWNYNNPSNFSNYLKLPWAGYRDSRNSSASYQGSYAFYWSSSRYNADNAHELSLGIGSPALNAGNNGYRANGYPVRCFKNSPTIPTSSWTKLYGTSIESGGIFWNSADGLISLSSDGQTWITIMDKNLGATTVWNSGNSLSEANCGWYFQRGNNYPFPFTGSVNTGSQVDASNYGPGNYYSSSTFITNRGRWDTTDNGNLRGGVDGNVPV